MKNSNIFMSVTHISEDGIEVIVKYPQEKYEEAVNIICRAHKVENPQQLSPPILRFTNSNYDCLNISV